MPYIASTLTCDQKYAHFVRNGDFLTEVEDQTVIVKGGFGLANQNFVTPTGAVMTPVTDAQLASLEKHSQFKVHQDKGFVKVIKSGSADGDKAASGMTLGDKSQPLNPQMYQKKDDEKPEIISVHTGPVKV